MLQRIRLRLARRTEGPTPRTALTALAWDIIALSSVGYVGPLYGVPALLCFAIGVVVTGRRNPNPGQRCTDPTMLKIVEWVFTRAELPVPEVFEDPEVSATNMRIRRLRNRNVLCVNTGIIDRLGVEATAAVVAHEAGHVAGASIHSRIRRFVTTHMVTVTVATILHVIAGSVVAATVAAAATVVVGLAEPWLSRRAEFVADRFACDLGLGNELIFAFFHWELIDRVKGYGPEPTRWCDSHPDRVQRIAALSGTTSDVVEKYLTDGSAELSVRYREIAAQRVPALA